MPTQPFLTTAEARAAHLRSLETHLTALELEAATLTDVRIELAELEAAMTVYRRLSPPATPAADAPRPRTSRPRADAPGPATSPSPRRPRRPRRGAEPPSFKEFALTHLDSLAQGVGENGADRSARHRALQPIQSRRSRRVA